MSNVFRWRPKLEFNAGSVEVIQAWPCLPEAFRDVALVVVIQAWPHLPEAIRKGILAMIRASE